MRGAKTGGRKKGTPNRTTTEIREAIKNIVEMKLDDIITDLDFLEPHQRVKYFIDLLPYVLPKEKEQQQGNHTVIWEEQKNYINLGNGKPPQEPIEIRVISATNAPPLASSESEIIM
jgi:hypothetical protein